MEENKDLGKDLEGVVQSAASAFFKAGFEAARKKTAVAVGSALAPGIGTIIGLGVEVTGKYIIALVLVMVLLFGSILSAIGAGREQELRASGYAGTTLPLSSQVLAYREAVEAAAEKYDSKEYVGLFLAVMMQESGGRAVDVFQCAESLGYGPQGLTGTAISTETSIDHGVHLLTQRLSKANVTSPTDRQNISLAIQSYNMGPGFIEFAVSNHNGYSVQAALDYQRIQSGGVRRTSSIEALGPYAYGDAYYVSHVYRYYPLGTAQNTYSRIPSLYQDDYPHVPFGSSNIATSGCGITSFCMVATYLSGRELLPAEAVEWCAGRYYVEGVGISWAYYQAAVTHFNLCVTVTQLRNPEAVLEALKEGKPVICSQAPGLFTSSGHMIVLSGIGEDGRVYVNDPNKANAVGKGYNSRSFDFMSEIDATAKQYWIFG